MNPILMNASGSSHSSIFRLYMLVRGSYCLAAFSAISKLTCPSLFPSSAYRINSVWVVHEDNNYNFMFIFVRYRVTLNSCSDLKLFIKGNAFSLILLRSVEYFGAHSFLSWSRLRSKRYLFSKLCTLFSLLWQK